MGRRQRGFFSPPSWLEMSRARRGASRRQRGHWAEVLGGIGSKVNKVRGSSESREEAKEGGTLHRVVRGESFPSQLPSRRL